MHDDASESDGVGAEGASKRQRERQHKIDANLRERKYKLHREEMVIVRKEARVQRQLMNVMMMSLLIKNGGDNVPCPPASPMNE